MNAEDVSKYYYCFTKLGFKGEGTFYKYIQKVTTKLIKTFDGQHCRYMFHKFDDIDQTRLNVGVRGRLMDRVLDLMKEGKIKGFDLHAIYQASRNLPASGERKLNDFTYQCQRHLEKLRYFV
jgi:hypothetical protein